MRVVNDVDMTAGVRRGIIVVVVVWIVHRRAEGDYRFVVVGIGFVCEDGESLLGCRAAGFNVESRGLGGSGRTRACPLLFCGTLLPFQDARPVI
jgi:hypothetical protein